MLTRRHIRAKVMQSVYAFVQSGRDNITVEQNNMLRSIDNIFDLYITLLELVVEVTAWDKSMIEKKKSRLSGRDKIPAVDELFANNLFTQKLADNTVLQQIVEDKRITWKNNDEYLQIILKEIKDSNLYTRYVARENHTFKSDKNFMVDVFKEIIATNEKLHEYFESENLSWIGDISVANSMAVKTLTLTFEDSEDDQHLMKLYKDQEDKEFAIDLFTKTVANAGKFSDLVAEKTPGWDAERIAQLDLIMMQMAVCEFMKFPSIPTKVTINEYLEISKDFSTPKSKVFINGVLDKLWRDLDKDGEINKSGRGLA